MTFRKAADGITKQGKTKGKNLGDSGPTVGIQSDKANKSVALSKAMKSVGRNMARANLQKHSGRGR
jgi:hypothetical protein